MATSTRARTRSSFGYAFAAWLGLGLLLWQAAFASGLLERPMSPFSVVDGAIVICTEHGARIIPTDGAPGRAPSDHSVPSCPCCLPFAAGNGGAILASPVMLRLPAWSVAQPVVALASPPLARGASSTPQQPRAPPLSV
jgi:hypothetical protein